MQLASLPQGDIEHMEFSDNGKLMAFYLNSDRSPANLYIHDLTTGKSRAMTQSLAKAINPDDLVDAEVVRFKSFDGSLKFHPIVSSSGAISSKLFFHPFIAQDDTPTPRAWISRASAIAKNSNL